MVGRRRACGGDEQRAVQSPDPSAHRQIPVHGVAYRGVKRQQSALLELGLSDDQTIGRQVLEVKSEGFGNAHSRWWQASQTGSRTSAV